MNGLNRSPSASSYERPGGLAQASHAAASMVAMDGTTRAVKLEDMGGQAVRSGGIAHLSTHGAVFVVKGLKPRARADRPEPRPRLAQGTPGRAPRLSPGTATVKSVEGGSEGSSALSVAWRRCFNPSA